MAVRRWTEGELETLYDHRREGAKAIAGLIERTPDAIRKKASELGISLDAKGYTVPIVCPHCGCYEVKPHTAAGAHGICEVCHLRNLRDAEREKAATIRARAEYNAARQDTFRARRGQ